MDRIVVLADHSGENQKLVTCLRMLFPECEIRLLPRRMESFEEAQVGLEPTSTDNGEKKNGKYLNHR